MNRDPRSMLGLAVALWLFSCSRAGSPRSPDGASDCAPSAFSCTSTSAVRFCDSDHRWQLRQCPFACNDGQCVGSCHPGERKCKGQELHYCAPGGAWRHDVTCDAFTTCNDHGGPGACNERHDVIQSRGSDVEVLLPHIAKVLSGASGFRPLSEEMQVAASPDGKFVAAFGDSYLGIVDRERCLAAPLGKPPSLGSCPWALVARVSAEGQRKAMAWAPSSGSIALVEHHGPSAAPESSVAVFSLKKKRVVERVHLSGIFVHNIVFVDESHLAVADHDRDAAIGQLADSRIVELKH